MAKKPVKVALTRKKAPLVDGMSPKDVKRIRSALRQVWAWSTPRRICIARATDKDGFGKCEQCRKRVPKLYADHVQVMGDVLAPDYIKRMWCSSKRLQALCKRCHDLKTREERLQAECESYGF